MSTPVTLWVSRDCYLVRRLSGSLDLGAGADHHLAVGKLSGGTHKTRFAIRLTMPDWDALRIAVVEDCDLKMKVRAAHTAIGSSPRFEFRFVTAAWTEGSWGGQGGGDPSAETWDVRNALLYPGPASVTSGPTPIDSGSLAGKSAGDIVTVSIMRFIHRWAPPSVYVNGYGFGLGETNNGMLAVSADDTLTSRVIEFDSSEGDYSPRAAMVFSSNAAPEAPGLDFVASPGVLGPDGWVTSDSTPTIQFHGVDADDSTVAMYNILATRVDTFGSASYLDQTSGITGMDITFTLTTPLVVGGTYDISARTKDPSGNWGPLGALCRITVNSATAPTIMEPAGGVVAKVVMTTGWNTPRLSVAHVYTDAERHPQAYYRWTVYTSNAAGANLGQAYQSEWVAGAATTAIIEHDLTNGAFYLLGVETIDAYGGQSPMSATRHTRVRWAVGTYYMDCSSAPTGTWGFQSQVSGVGLTSAVYFEYSSSASTTPGTFRSSTGAVALARYFFYRVWLMAWGASPVSPAVTSATLTYSSSTITPDHWGLSSANVTVDRSEYVYGRQSLRIAGSPTASYAYQGNVGAGQRPIILLPDTDYVLSGRIKNVGAANGRLDLLDQTGAVLLSTAAVASDSAWHGTQSVVFNSGAVTSVQMYCWADGAAGTLAFFDAVKLEPSRVATPWSPGLVGVGSSVDAGGVQIDKTAGAVFRLMAEGGDPSRNIVELATDGLRFGTDGPDVHSPVANILHVDTIRLTERATPATPPSGFGYLYLTTGGVLRFINDAGTDTQVS